MIKTFIKTVFAIVNQFIKTKVTHPADINNGTDKIIMGIHEKYFIKIPPQCHTLQKSLDIPDNHCVYCGEYCDKLTTDEIIPCKDGGRYSKNGNHLNMVQCCNNCNRSKSGMTGEELLKWIDEGPKGGKNPGESRIPQENRTRMKEWIKRNIKRGYLKTNDLNILERIKLSHIKSEEMLKKHYEWAMTNIYERGFERFYISSDEEE